MDKKKYEAACRTKADINLLIADADNVPFRKLCKYNSKF